MRKCPACGYVNAEAAACGVCGRDLSGIPDRTAPARKTDRIMPALAALLLCCALAAFFLASRRPAAPAPADNSFSDEAGFGYEGLLYSMTAMESMRFLPPEDKLKILPFLSSRDERVACAAAGLAGAWLRSGEDAQLAASLTAALLDAAGEGPASLRKQAAAQLVLALPGALNPAAYGARLRAAVSSLTASGDEELRSAGFLLAAAAGFSDFSGEMLSVMRHDPVSSSKLSAACALVRFGDAEAHALLLAMGAGGDEALAGQAAGCLASSRLQGEGGRLKRVSQAGPAGEKTR